jgi:hypothetical protein
VYNEDPLLQLVDGLTIHAVLGMNSQRVIDRLGTLFGSRQGLMMVRRAVKLCYGVCLTEILCNLEINPAPKSIRRQSPSGTPCIAITASKK